MSQATNALDDLLMMESGGGTPAPALPIVNTATTLVAAGPIATPPAAALIDSVTPPNSALVTPPGTPPVEKKKRGPRKPKVTADGVPVGTDGAPAAQGMPDPVINFTPTHLSTMGGPGTATIPAGPPQDLAPAVAMSTGMPSQPTPTLKTPPVQNTPTQTFPDLASASNGNAAPLANNTPAAPVSQPFSFNSNMEPDDTEMDPGAEANIAQELAEQFGDAFVPAQPGPIAPTPQPTPVQNQPAAQSVASIVKTLTPPGATLTVEDNADEILACKLQQAAIERAFTHIANLTGMVTLTNKDGWDRNSTVQEAMHFMRWEPMLLQTKPLNVLCAYEAALASNQAYVQGLENQWAARHAHLSKEFERVMFSRRNNHKSADGVRGQELELLRKDPDARKIKNDFILAQALRDYLIKLGESLVVLAHGIKRSIDGRQNEYRQSSRGNSHTP